MESCASVVGQGIDAENGPGVCLGCSTRVSTSESVGEGCSIPDWVSLGPMREEANVQMNVDQLVKKAQGDFAKFSKMPVNGVTGLSKTEKGWVVSLEALERRAIPDTMDILGLYEVQMDDEGNFLSFERKKLRKRGETKED